MLFSLYCEFWASNKVSWKWLLGNMMMSTLLRNATALKKMVWKFPCNESYGGQLLKSPWLIVMVSILLKNYECKQKKKNEPKIKT